MTNVGIAKIELDRVEGLCLDCYCVPAENMEKAEAILNRWRGTASQIGYDKIDFAIHFTDGHMYEGRYHLTSNPESSLPKTLTDHILNRLNVMPFVVRSNFESILGVA